MSGPIKSQVAYSTPFDNSTNGFTAIDVQAAIEEIDTTITATLMFAVTAGYNGNATTGKYLEFLTGVGSDEDPYVLPRTARLRYVSIATRNNCTGTVSILNNGSSITSVSLSSAQAGSSPELSISLAAMDNISVQITSGTMDKPIVYIHIQLVE